MSPKFLFTIFVLVSFACAHMGGHSASQDTNPRIYCGRDLARMIAQICYDDPTITKKRSEDATMYGNLIPAYYKEHENHIGWPWIFHKSTALGSIKGKRFVGGVADECCDKPCSINELLDYC